MCSTIRHTTKENSSKVVTVVIIGMKSVQSGAVNLQLMAVTFICSDKMIVIITPCGIAITMGIHGHQPSSVITFQCIPT